MADTNQANPEEQVVDINEQMRVRQEKLKALREQGNAYPNNF